MLQNYQNKRWNVEKVDDKDSFWDLRYLNVAAILIESSLGQTTQNTDCANLLG